MKTKLLTLIVASVFVLGSTLQPAKAGSDTEVFSTLIGAAVGGFVGSNVGKGKGQLAATAVGVLLGAGIGNTIATSDTGYNNTVYTPRDNSEPRVVYKPRPRVVERVVYVERPVERVVYVKQKPRYRTKHVVVHHIYGPPKHAKAYGWKKNRRKDDRRRVYYNKRSYKNERYVPYRHNS